MNKNISGLHPSFIKKLPVITKSQESKQYKNRKSVRNLKKEVKCARCDLKLTMIELINIQF